jgi:hypothetical protein
MGRSLNLGILSLIMDRELILSWILCYGSIFIDGYTLKLKSIIHILGGGGGGGGGGQKIARKEKKNYIIK